MNVKPMMSFQYLLEKQAFNYSFMEATFSVLIFGIRMNSEI